MHRLIARALFVAAVTWMGTALSQPALAQSVSEADRSQIIATIQSQLDAFQRDDRVEAFSYASPMLQLQFQSPDYFMDMVISGYMPVYRPQYVEFQYLDTTGAEPIQDVYLVGPDGEPVIARYRMERQPDGSWRISGCYLEKPGLSA